MLTAISAGWAFSVRDELALRPLEHQPRQMLAQRFVDFLEGLARGGEGVGELAAHADGLRPLAGEDQRAAHGRGAIALRSG